MHPSRTYLAFAFVMASALPTSAASAPADERLHVEFQTRMPAYVQTLTSGGRDVDETWVGSYAYRKARGEAVKAPVGYVVRAAPSGCDKPGQPCPDRRDALPDERSGDLPTAFNIEISEDPSTEIARRALRSTVGSHDGDGPWSIPAEGLTPFPPYGNGTARVLGSQAAKLRSGALAQADCFAGVRLCTVRVSYSSDLRVNFISSESDEAIARQVLAVDAFIRSVIRPGPAPDPRARPGPGPAIVDQAHTSFITGLPLERIQTMLKTPR